MNMKKFKNIKIFINFFMIFLFSLTNVSAMKKNVSAMKKNDNFSKKEISYNIKNSGTIYLLSLSVPEYSTCGCSNKIIRKLKNIDAQMADFVKTNFKKYNFKNKGIRFDGKRSDIFKFYKLMYESFAGSFKQFKKYPVYDPKNIDYVGISEDYSTAYLNLNYCDSSEDGNVEKCEDDSCLERYACEALIREMILYYIKCEERMLKHD